MTPPNRFLVSPDPPVGNGYVTVCYDFAMDPAFDGSVDIYVSVDNAQSSHTLNPADPCVQILLPSGSLILNLHDTSGNSDDSIHDIAEG